jgi:exonuclease V gamma subunit
MGDADSIIQLEEPARRRKAPDIPDPDINSDIEELTNPQLTRFIDLISQEIENTNQILLEQEELNAIRRKNITAKINLEDIVTKGVISRLEERGRLRITLDTSEWEYCVARAKSAISFCLAKGCNTLAKQIAVIWKQEEQSSRSVENVESVIDRV